MMIKIIRLVALISVSAIASSCEGLFFEKDMASSDPYDNFDYLWKECDKKYSYFELKNIDWNAVREEYRAKLYDGMTDDSLFNVLGAMLNELHDDHTNLISDFNISMYNVEFKTRSQSNFNWRVIVDNYITNDYYVSGPFIHNYLCDKEIGYVYFHSFTGTVDDENLDFVLNRYKDTKGLIIDLRQNGGGAASDIFNILSRFVEKKTLLYYSRIKNGPGHNDFSDPVPAYVEPYDGIRYKKDVYFLTDRGTFSAGSFISLASKALDNITLVGDTTGGGLGAPNGGQLPNGWKYRFSVTQALTLDKKNDYEKGVPPDVYATFDWNNMKKDEILDRAIQEILQK